jgi:hypothetical protein
MLIGNVRSARDLEDKRLLQKQLLELEAENENVRQKRVQESGVRALEPQKIQEQYKTTSELQKDRATLEKKAQDNFIELGFNYTEAGQLTRFISNENKLGAFNASFKDIKRELTEKYEPTLINEQFIINYLQNYFDDLEVNLGKKFGRESINQPIDIFEYNTSGITNDLIGLMSIYPDRRELIQLQSTLSDMLNYNRDLTKNLGRNKKIKTDDFEYPLSVETASKIALAGDLVSKFSNLMPTEEFINDANISLTQNERLKLAKALDRAFRLSKTPTQREIQTIGMAITTFANSFKNAPETGVRPDFKRFYLVLDRLIRQLSSIGSKSAGNAFDNFYEDYKKSINTKGEYSKLAQDLSAQQEQIRQSYIKTIDDLLAEIEEDTIPVEEQNRERLENNEMMAEEILMHKNDYEIGQQQLEGEQQKLLEQEQALAQALVEKKIGIEDYVEELFFTAEGLKDAGMLALARLITDRFYIQGLKKGVKQPYLDVADYVKLLRIQQDGGKVGKAKRNTIFFNLKNSVKLFSEANPEYDPRHKQAGFQVYKPRGAPNGVPSETPAGVFGLGTNPKYLKKLKKHFKGDEALLKKVVKALDDDSSSDEEEQKELNRHIKATNKVDKKLEKLVGSGRTALGDLTAGAYAVKDYLGLGFQAKRIPVGKVGKGVKLEKEDNPTYRQFGKYVIHLPYLLNNNVANFKYPSLGSIPSIKPLTISDDYKDLILETLQTGKLNKKELERLPQNEIKHFEKVAIGAGLVEQLGMKIGSTEEDKADTKRFDILRGEYLAGNNNEKMIKELRLLITKFINNGRIHKNEGLNLLLELSTV